MKGFYKSLDELPVFLRVEEVALVLNISRATAYNLTKSGEIPTVKIKQKRIVVPKEELLRWIEKNTKK